MCRVACISPVEGALSSPKRSAVARGSRPGGSTSNSSTQQPVVGQYWQGRDRGVEAIPGTVLASEVVDVSMTGPSGIFEIIPA